MPSRKSLPIYRGLAVASPCDAKWSEMEGDERSRFCRACEKHVYDLSMLEPEEIVDLIHENEGSFCRRLHIRRDRRVMHGDCSVGVARAAAGRMFRMSLALLATLVALVAGVILSRADEEPVMTTSDSIETERSSLEKLQRSLEVKAVELDPAAQRGEEDIYETEISMGY